MKYLVFLLAGAAAAVALRAERIEIGWPTPNPAYYEGRPLADFVQPTASGQIESGLFGCRRSGGAQFHEALDLKPVRRDRRGEPADPVFAALKGVVRHISRQPGNSSYGRYIVLEHPDVEPAVYTLYAHLAGIAPGLGVGEAVVQGQTLGTMGRSASGQAIPKTRAHLHFEIGVWLTRDFQRWYEGKKFGSRNQHGVWNGMNLYGLDPLDFYNQFRARRVDTFSDYFARMPAAVRLRIATRRIPDYVARYPSLQTRPPPTDGLIGGWEVRVNETGLPFAFTPLSPMEMMGFAPDEVRVIEVDQAVIKRNRCRSLVFSRRGSWAIGRDLAEVLQLVFGVR